MRKLVFYFLMIQSVLVFSQTGPGGVGNSADNVLWLDGSKGVIDPGSGVASWQDQSGNNNHANAPGSLQQPAIATGAVNGFDALLFDGTNDQLSVAGNSSLDLQEWHVFMVVRVTVMKNYNTWFAKGDYLQENYGLLSYSNGNLRSPIRFTDGNVTVVNSAAGQVTTTEFNIIEYSYSPSYGRDIYKNNNLVHTDNNDKIPAATASPLYIGYEPGSGDRYLNGAIAEILFFNRRLNSSQRIIINNYLAARYNRSLVSNDVYDEDNIGFDHEVAGIGRLSLSDFNDDACGTGRVRMLNPADLGIGEFLIWGHDNGEMMAVNFTDVPTGVAARSDRVWRVSERNTVNTAPVDVGAVDIQFDLDDLGPITASDLRLLIDSDNDGFFSDEIPIAGAFQVLGNTYGFNGITGLSDNIRFTIATINIVQTPLPVQLLSFTADQVGADAVKLQWVTASEVNSDHFTLQRSMDTEVWMDLATIEAAGNSTIKVDYTWTDHDPNTGTSYYRLKQVDLNGDFVFSEMLRIELDPALITVYPNPFVNQVQVQADREITLLNIYSPEGKLLANIPGVNGFALDVDLSDYPSGYYTVEVVSPGTRRFIKILKL
jgi:hypothetical protein